jgi:hypothetical protein
MDRFNVIALAYTGAVCRRAWNDVEGNHASWLSHVHPCDTIIRLDESRALLEIQH